MPQLNVAMPAGTMMFAKSLPLRRRSLFCSRFLERRRSGGTRRCSLSLFCRNAFAENRFAGTRALH
jgi:hypothetical protein